MNFSNLCESNCNYLVSGSFWHILWFFGDFFNAGGPSFREFSLCPFINVLKYPFKNWVLMKWKLSKIRISGVIESGEGVEFEGNWWNIYGKWGRKVRKIDKHRENEENGALMGKIMKIHKNCQKIKQNLWNLIKSGKFLKIGKKICENSWIFFFWTF